jgi:hypothetical protein
MVGQVAAAFFLFCFFFLSLWKAVEMWKTVGAGWSSRRYQVISEGGMMSPSGRRLVTNKILQAPEAQGKTFERGGGREQRRMLRWCLTKTRYKDCGVPGMPKTI